MRKTVLVGMSGGVDSSVAAALLKKEYQVCGVTLKLHDACAPAVEDAQAVCTRLGIDHYVQDYSTEFQQFVIDNFISEYLCARTPNPCVWCNYYIKFGVMLALADTLGADYIATGHYVTRGVDEQSGEYTLETAASGAKDQTYALYRLRQRQLSRALFPVGALPKPEVRELARSLGLNVAEKKDSQEICFIPQNDYAAYIEARAAKSQPGPFIGPEGEILGTHKGLIHYTVGQRRGLGIAYRERLYVARLDPVHNAVHLGCEGVQNTQIVYAADATFLSDRPPEKEFDCTAKIRYNGRAAPAHVSVDGEQLTVHFIEPQRAAAPGQSVVLYDGTRVLGGGIIVDKPRRNCLV